MAREELDRVCGQSAVAEEEEEEEEEGPRGLRCDCDCGSANDSDDLASPPPPAAFGRLRRVGLSGEVCGEDPGEAGGKNAADMPDIDKSCVHTRDMIKSKKRYTGARAAAFRRERRETGEQVEGVGEEAKDRSATRRRKKTTKHTPTLPQAI